MVELINNLTKNIVIAITLSTLIEMMLPDGSIKKYVRSIIGLYIVFIIINPFLILLKNRDIEIKNLQLPENTTIQTRTIDTNSYIESSYINRIKDDIKNKVEEKRIYC